MGAVNRSLNLLGLCRSAPYKQAGLAGAIGGPHNSVKVETRAADKFRFALSAMWMKSERRSGGKPEGRKSRSTGVVSS